MNVTQKSSQFYIVTLVSVDQELTHANYLYSKSTKENMN